MTEIAPKTVFVNAREVFAFASTWPCSGMHFASDIAITFQFDSGLNLIDIGWLDAFTGLDIPEPKGVNGEALLALSQDASRWLADSRL